MRAAVQLFLFILIVGSCQRTDDGLDCPDQADRTLDVLSGPLLPARGTADWAYLGNQYGGRGEALAVTGYPFFLNWLAGCEEDVSVNISGYRTEILQFPGNAVVSARHARLHSFHGLSTGETVNLAPLVGRRDFPRHPLPIWESRTIVIENVPPLTLALTIPKSVSGNVNIMDHVPGTLRLEVDAWFARLGYFYLALAEQGADEFYAVKIDPLAEQSVYDYPTDRIPVDYHRLFFGPEVTYAGLYEITDEDTRPLSLFTHGLHNEWKEFLAPRSDASYLLYLSNHGDTISSSSAQLYNDVPTTVDASRLNKNPLLSLEQVGDFLELELQAEGYIRVSTDLGEYPGQDGVRQLEGPLSAGKHRLRLHDLPDAFRLAHPGVELPKDVFERNYQFSFWQYPVVPTAAAYWQLGELSLVDRHLFTYYHQKVY